MANRRSLVDIDLNQNQLLNAVVQNLATPPANPLEGQMYFDTSKDREGFWGFVRGVWVELSNIYDHPTYTALKPTLSGANVLATFETDSRGHVVTASTRLLTLADLGYTGSPNANRYIHPTFPNNGLGGSLLGAKVVSNIVVNSEGHVVSMEHRDLTPADIGAAVINDSVTNLISTWSSSKIQDKLDDIASLIVGALIYKGGYNAATNTPDLATGIGIEQGWTYTITTSGTFLGEEVQVGDMIIAEKNDPSGINEWTTVNKNIPDIVDATMTDKGIIRIGTQAEVLAGVSTNTAVVPATLVAFYNAQQAVSGYAVTIGNDAATSYDITHGLNTRDVLVQVFEDSSGDEVGVQARRVSDNEVRILVNIPLVSTELRVVMRKA